MGQQENDTVKVLTMKGESMISSIRLEENPRHDHLHIWNRGGKSGVLCVDHGDGLRIATRLLSAPSEYHLTIHDYETGEKIQ